MADFPSIENPDYVLGQKTKGSTVKNESESGYIQTRARYTRLRKIFQLQWGMLSATDFATLETFFESTAVAGANSFTWTHPLTSTEYTVRFADDELNFQLAVPGPSGYYKGSVTLSEV